MSVQFTGQAEKERVEKNQERRAKPKWELLVTTSIVEALHFARDNGWQDKKVQVRFRQTDNSTYEYSVEPWEKDCTCPDILRFADYFDPQ